MQLSDLRAEMQARGFDYLSTARCNTYLNVAVQEICELEDWPFLLATTTGAAPLTIADLRTVQTVVDVPTNRKLRPSNLGQITDTYPAPTTTGSPVFYYFTSQNTISVFPVNTAEQIKVTYWKTPADMVADTDVPVIPARYQYAIVDYACGRAFADASDFNEAQAARAEGDRLVQMMQANLVDPQHDSPELIRTAGGLDW